MTVVWCLCSLLAGQSRISLCSFTVISHLCISFWHASISLKVAAVNLAVLLLGLRAYGHLWCVMRSCVTAASRRAVALPFPQPAAITGDACFVIHGIVADRCWKLALCSDVILLLSLLSVLVRAQRRTRAYSICQQLLADKSLSLIVTVVQETSVDVKKIGWKVK